MDKDKELTPKELKNAIKYLKEHFELPNGKTMAELTNEEKYKYIPRAKALNKLKEFIGNDSDINI